MNDKDHMKKYMTAVRNAADHIRARSEIIPMICVTLGSGLASLSDALDDKTEIFYRDIPGFPETTVSGHEGVLITGKINGTPVMMMKGRFHWYEGHSTRDLTFPIRVFAELGIKTLILTNAAGGVNKKYQPGELMVITDHIGMFCDSPLRGINIDEYGPRFPDQTHVYDWQPIMSHSIKLGLKIHKGIYFYAKGPMYETPAEIRMIAALGGDAVGMSTVPEAIVASHSGIRVMGISTITNYAAGLTDQPLSHDDVIKVGFKASDDLKRLIISLISDGEIV